MEHSLWSTKDCVWNGYAELQQLNKVCRVAEDILLVLVLHWEIYAMIHKLGLLQTYIYRRAVDIRTQPQNNKGIQTP